MKLNSNKPIWSDDQWHIKNLEIQEREKEKEKKFIQ